MRAMNQIKNLAAELRLPLLLCLVLLTILGAAQEGPKVIHGFVLQAGDGPTADVFKGPNSQVIETPEQLAKFAARIPEQLPHKRKPARPNPDPLRKDFTLDFSKEILVIAVHHDTISAFPNYQGVKESGKVRVVEFEVPGRPSESRPYGWAVYTAVILPKVAIPTELKLTSVPSKQ